jgi:hypothetical protein
MSDNEDM